jgi:hypothetical protein
MLYKSIIKEGSVLKFEDVNVSTWMDMEMDGAQNFRSDNLLTNQFASSGRARPLPFSSSLPFCGLNPFSSPSSLPLFIPFLSGFCAI